MPKDTQASMQIVTREDEYASRGSRGLTDRVELVTRTFDMDKVKQNFTQFVSGLQSLMDTTWDETSVFQLKEVQFSAEVSATGEFKLLGTGVGIQGSSTITFVLQRKEFM